jgi:hypothetical protein
VIHPFFIFLANFIFLNKGFDKMKPVEGRIREGGQRMGEIEREAIAADTNNFQSNILNDVVWFARAPVATAKKYLDEPSLLEYIERTRMAPLYGKDDADGTAVAYPLDEVIPVGSNYILIMFQVDRYSNLKRHLLMFRCEPTRVRIKCDTMEEFEQKRKELAKTHSTISYSEEALELGYIDDGPKTFTAGEILEHIYRFYSSAMIETELQAVAQTDDGFGYSERAARALEDGTVLYREEVMGDCMHFEGLRLVGHAVGKDSETYPVYSVNFGS